VVWIGRRRGCERLLGLSGERMLVDSRGTEWCDAHGKRRGNSDRCGTWEVDESVHEVGLKEKLSHWDVMGDRRIRLRSL